MQLRPGCLAENSGPTDWGNYDLATREGDGLDIDRIVIHDTEASYDDTLDIFQTPTSYVAAHYVVRSADGFVTQMVQNRDIGYQAGNYYFNEHSIGIEIEGYALEGNTYYTPAMYDSAAALVAYLADRYDIPLNRRHIVGHDEIPGPNLTYQAGMRWDPGTFFNWNKLMRKAGAKKPSGNGLPEVGDAVVIRPGFAGNQPPVLQLRHVGAARLLRPAAAALELRLPAHRPAARRPLYLGSVPIRQAAGAGRGRYHPG